VLPRPTLPLIAIALLAACGGGGDDPPAAPPANFAVAGTIQGRSGGGLALALNGEPLAVADTATAYVFPTRLPQGSSYAVTVQAAPRGQECNVLRGTGFVQGDVDAPVLCAAARYTVSGQVTGLTSGGLRLRSGFETLDVPAGATSFVIPRALHGSSYDVQVASEPAGLRCQVHRGQGTIDAAPVADVLVACALFVPG
jgi:hypothetical protein